MRRVVMVLGTFMLACSRGEAPPDATAPRTAQLVAVVDSLATPESAIYDHDLDLWFVSNINGHPTAKDNNGFISRIHPDGTIESLRFIAGGSPDVTLHAPKGSAIIGDTLWVADIDHVRGFHKRTGVPLADVDLSGRAQFLNDLAVHIDGVLYATDSGLQFDADGNMTHSGPDQVFDIRGGRARVSLTDERLLAPNGLAWHPVYKLFVLVSFAGTGIYHWGPNIGLTDVGEGPGGLDGVVVLPGNMMLVSSWADSTVFLMGVDRVRIPLITNVPSPADIGYDPTRSQIAIPLFTLNQVQIWTIPATG